MVEKSERVPRTRVPEVIKNQPRPLSRQEQLVRLQEWDTFIANLNTRPGMNLKERWEEIDRKFIERRNKEIGWKIK